MLSYHAAEAPIAPEPGAGPGEGEHPSSLVDDEVESDPDGVDPDDQPSLCLGVLNGSVEDGAVLTLSPCVTPGEAGSGAQQWNFLEDDGPGPVVMPATEQCMTAGWPFFTGVAVRMSPESSLRYKGDYAVVLLNEAEEPVEFDLSFPEEMFRVRTIIAPRSIQTILA